MGDLAKIAVTGAAGFIGRNVVSIARSKGHPVIAVVRDARKIPENWFRDSGIEIAECDLAGQDASARLHQVLKSAKSVVHAASAMSGNRHLLCKDTLRATDTLLSVLTVLGRSAPHLVFVSSIVVYDYGLLEPGQVLDEEAPLERFPQKRDTYAGAKIAQENRVVEVTRAQGLSCTILRPGVVYDSEHLANALFGPSVGPLLFVLKKTGDVPICHVTNCSAALVQAAISCPVDTLNLVDDTIPTRREYLAGLKSTGRSVAHIPVPKFLRDAVVNGFAIIPALDARLPGFLRKTERRARLLPLSYTNRKARRVLQWKPVSHWPEEPEKTRSNTPEKRHV